MSASNTPNADEIRVVLTVTHVKQLWFNWRGWRGTKNKTQFLIMTSTPKSHSGKENRFN